MSSAADGMIARGRRLFWTSVRSGGALRWAGIGLGVIVAIVVLALVYGDLPEFVRLGGRMRELFRHYTYLTGFALLYIEESGIPLPAPGDVFVLFVGAHIPHNVFAFMVAWFGLILAVTAGATNLFFLSKKYGRQLVDSRYAAYVHLSPERVARAEKWFRRYGMLAIIFGRHIPGFRVPITVAAGVFKVPYRVFAPSVAVSTAIWAGIVLFIGINFGSRFEAFLRVHSLLYFVWGAIVVALVVGIFVGQRREDAARAARAVEKVGR
ncbi:MAG TPA: DedA family protein [Candidatus Dormibacteraeota bacterium]|nr:DedA family protein [Candidatus Dormibacteraeota bacterium]